MPAEPFELRREIERFPYVPAEPASRTERCEEVYNIQVRGLQTRLLATGIEKIVIGVSGGLDSTHALIVAARAIDRLGLPRPNVLAYTMPGFATSSHTLENSHRLMEALGVSANELDIRPSATQMLHDLGHPAAGGEPDYDVTYENVQAGERTSHLFRLANLHGGLVLGTGDLSELALGWSTYGVGDQMSHYNVNGSVPKTLIQFLLRWAIETEQFSDAASQVLGSVLETAISPELVPTEDPDSDRPGADSESVVGPYELQDFFLYYFATVRLPSEQDRVPGLAGVGRSGARQLARPDPGGAPRRVLAERDQALARGLPDPLLPRQPVQALGAAQRPQGRHGRLTVAARRLACAERRERAGVAGRARGPGSGRRVMPAHRPSGRVAIM